VDIDILRVFIVAEKCLSVLPAVKTSNLSELCVGDIGQRFALSVTVDSTLNVGGLDLAAVKNNGAGLVDKRLTPSVRRVVRSVAQLTCAM
jgi:hypothetical protein